MIHAGVPEKSQLKKRKAVSLFLTPQQALGNQISGGYMKEMNPDAFERIFYLLESP